MIRRATVTPADPGATSTNSSPPVRPSVSTSRTLEASTLATCRSTRSPTRAPDASLSARKASTSNTAAERPGPVERGVVDRVVGVRDDVRLVRGDVLVDDPEGEQQLERVPVGVLREDGDGGRASGCGARLDDHGQRRVEVVRPRECRG